MFSNLKNHATAPKNNLTPVCFSRRIFTGNTIQFVLKKLSTSTQKVVKFNPQLLDFTLTDSIRSHFDHANSGYFFTLVKSQSKHFIFTFQQLNNLTHAYPQLYPH